MQNNTAHIEGKIDSGVFSCNGGTLVSIIDEGVFVLCSLGRKFYTIAQPSIASCNANGYVKPCNNSNASASISYSSSLTPTISPFLSVSISNSVTVTPSVSSSVSASSSVSESATNSSSKSASSSFSMTSSPSTSASLSGTASTSPTVSVSVSPSSTTSSSYSATSTPSVSSSVSASSTGSATPSNTDSLTASASMTPSITATMSPTTSATSTAMPSLSSSASPTSSGSASLSTSQIPSSSTSVSLSSSSSQSGSKSQSSSASTSPSSSPTATASTSDSASSTVSSTSSNSYSTSFTASLSNSISSTASASHTLSSSSTSSTSLTAAPSKSDSTSESYSSSPSISFSKSQSISASASAKISVTPTSTVSLSNTHSVSVSQSPSESFTGRDCNRDNPGIPNGNCNGHYKTLTATPTMISPAPLVSNEKNINSTNLIANHTDTSHNYLPLLSLLGLGICAVPIAYAYKHRENGICSKKKALKTESRVIMIKQSAASTNEFDNVFDIDTTRSQLSHVDSLRGYNARQGLNNQALAKMGIRTSVIVPVSAAHRSESLETKQQMTRMAFNTQFSGQRLISCGSQDTNIRVKTKTLHQRPTDPAIFTGSNVDILPGGVNIGVTAPQISSSRVSAQLHEHLEDNNAHVVKAQIEFNNILINSEIWNIALQSLEKGKTTGLLLDLGQDQEIAKQILEASAIYSPEIISKLLFGEKIESIAIDAFDKQGGFLTDSQTDQELTLQLYSSPVTIVSDLHSAALVSFTALKIIESKEIITYLLTEVLPVLKKSTEDELMQRSQMSFIQKEGIWITLHLTGEVAFSMFSPTTDRISTFYKITLPIISTAGYTSHHLYHQEVKWSLLGEYAERCLINSVVDGLFIAILALPAAIYSVNPNLAFINGISSGTTSFALCYLADNELHNADNPDNIVSNIVAGTAFLSVFAYSYKQGLFQMVSYSYDQIIPAISKISATLSIATLAHKIAESATDKTIEMVQIFTDYCYEALGNINSNEEL